jgi:transposase
MPPGPPRRVGVAHSLAGHLPNIQRRFKGELAQTTRVAILQAIENGVTPVQVQRTFGISRSTYYYTLKRWNEGKAVASKARSGRPRKLDARDIRAILRIVRRSPRVEYAELILEARGLANLVSRSTIYRILKKAGITNWVARKRPQLSPKDARNRLQWARWARLELRQDPQFFYKVKFSDECSVVRGSGRKRVWVFRTPHQKWHKDMVDGSRRQGGIQQMSYAAIWKGGRSHLIEMTRNGRTRGYNSQSYCDAMEEGLLPWDDDYLYMQDNSRLHTSRETMDWLTEHGIKTIDWAPYSPDMNPIEHLWWLLKQKLFELFPDLEFTGASMVEKEHFIDCAREAWLAIDQLQIDNLIDSMPKRVDALIKARGWQTKY